MIILLLPILSLMSNIPNRRLIPHRVLVLHRHDAPVKRRQRRQFTIGTNTPRRPRSTILADMICAPRLNFVRPGIRPLDESFIPFIFRFKPRMHLH